MQYLSIGRVHALRYRCKLPKMTPKSFSSFAICQANTRNSTWTILQLKQQTFFLYIAYSFRTTYLTFKFMSIWMKCWNAKFDRQMNSTVLEGKSQSYSHVAIVPCLSPGCIYPACRQCHKEELKHCQTCWESRGEKPFWKHLVILYSLIIFQF